MNDLLQFAEKWANLTRAAQDEVQDVINAETPEQLERTLLWSNGLEASVDTLAQSLRNINTEESRDMLAKLETAVKEIA